MWLQLSPACKLCAAEPTAEPCCKQERWCSIGRRGQSACPLRGMPGCTAMLPQGQCGAVVNAIAYPGPQPACLLRGLLGGCTPQLARPTCHATVAVVLPPRHNPRGQSACLLRSLLGGCTPQLVMRPSHETVVSSGSKGCQLQSRTRDWWYCSFATCTRPGQGKAGKTMGSRSRRCLSEHTGTQDMHAVHQAYYVDTEAISQVRQFSF